MGEILFITFRMNLKRTFPFCQNLCVCKTYFECINCFSCISCVRAHIDTHKHTHKCKHTHTHTHTHVQHLMSTAKDYQLLCNEDKLKALPTVSSRHTYTQTCTRLHLSSYHGSSLHPGMVTVCQRSSTVQRIIWWLWWYRKGVGWQ